MGKQYKKLKPKDIEFIKEQKLFFIASCSGEEVNLSPKGYDSLRVIDEETLIFLDYPGSGNRTARDIANSGEVTVMFTAFSGKANITKLFCKGELVDKECSEFDKLLELFGENSDIVRRLVRLKVYAVETSCGESIPYMEYKGERDELKEWANKLNTQNKLNDYIQKQHTPPDLSKLD
jgi:hypothetical protein